MFWECISPSSQTVTVCVEPGKWREEGGNIIIDELVLNHPAPDDCNNGTYSAILSKSKPHVFATTPVTADPITVFDYNIEERDGGVSSDTDIIQLAEWHLYGSSAQGRVATVKPDGINYANTLEESETFGYIQRELSEKFYEIKDHLGNVRLVFSDMKKVEADPNRKPYALDLTAVNNYYPFGMLMPENNWQAGLSRYGFNGHENDNEVKGTGNHIAFGDYGYDTRLGRRWQIEPLIDKYPNFSSYLAYGNNPILFLDEDGLSGKISIDKINKTITITSHYNFYGSEASEEFATQTALDIQNAWNAANGTVENNGVTYEVNFIVTGSYNPELEDWVVEGYYPNSDASQNYVRVEKEVLPTMSTNASNHRIGGNWGYWLIDQVNGANTLTEAHEYGHGLGLGHHSKPYERSDLRTPNGNSSQPSIMFKRGDLVDAQWTYSPEDGATEGAFWNFLYKHPWDLTYYNTLDPNKRIVTQQDILNLGIGNMDLENGPLELGGAVFNQIFPAPPGVYREIGPRREDGTF